MMGCGYGWDGALWMLGRLLLLIGAIALVVWIILMLSRPGRAAPSDPSRPTPNEILRERFARGEISEAEFEQARKVLGPDR